MKKEQIWKKIFFDLKILNHDFNKKPFEFNLSQIKQALKHFNYSTNKISSLLKQENRDVRPNIFKENNLFILPIKKSVYCIVKGEGYFDIPDINSNLIMYKSILDFKLDSLEFASSNVQYVDFAYASSLIRTFMNDPTLVLTIRGRKYTPEFSFFVNKQKINVKGVQTEVDAGYEGKDQIVLVEAKNGKCSNTIIRQLYYPFRQWSEQTNKKVNLLFFEKKKNIYYVWQYEFTDSMDYNSLKLIKSSKFLIN
jgi:hypothetical protein